MLDSLCGRDWRAIEAQGEGGRDVTERFFAGGAAKGDHGEAVGPEIITWDAVAPIDDASVPFIGRAD